MIDLYRRQLAFWRAAELDIFVLPCPWPMSGMAFCTPASESPTGKIRLHINIVGSVNSTMWLFVLLHEVAHHALRHTVRVTRQPTWHQEYEADQYALKLLAEFQPAAVERCERFSREHIRPLLQSMIDWEIWHHVDRDIAAWAGCDLSALPHPYIDHADDEGIPF
jgi:Zn-dependent protease with chaperone function